ncbi:MAG: ABC transporter ATP-binding protein [Lachnospiraceae bacterium]
MIGVFKKIWNFADKEQGNIKKSLLIGFFNAVFNALQLGAVYLVLLALVDGSRDTASAWKALAVMAVSVIGKIVTQYFSQLQRTHAGYFMVAGKRISLGDKLISVPMGYFNENSLGQITAIGTTILSEVENSAPVVLVTTLGGFLNSLVFTLAIFIYDWRIGLIVAAGMVLFLYVTSLMEKATRVKAPFRQAAQANLVEAVLETIQGMSVVKAFSLEENKDKRIDQTIDDSCVRNLGMEKAMTPYIIMQQLILGIFSVLIMICSIRFYLNGTMMLATCLMMLIASFMVFEQLKSVGSSMANLRLTETSINRSNEMEDVPVMDERGTDIRPQNCDINFDKVSFAYDRQEVLHDVSLNIPEKTMTAIVGPSGSGKTTLCSLISRFWDVGQGQVSIGGEDVRNYKLDSLLANISIVFQNVYLFNDTIENNIRFGNPKATYEEIEAVAKAACCHDFIMEFPDGYQTIIGEGGASLSGGEKQRISIARAMLKNAPIVIFDEATANVDPENEDRLQAAIEALTKEKTIIMIAHRLKTVRNADQILVLDKGRIVDRGTHEQLINVSDIYTRFVSERKTAIGWKLV